jgi:hypothetical protein
VFIVVMLSLRSKNTLFYLTMHQDHFNIASIIAWVSYDCANELRRIVTAYGCLIDKGLY